MNPPPHRQAPSSLYAKRGNHLAQVKVIKNTPLGTSILVPTLIWKIDEYNLLLGVNLFITGSTCDIYFERCVMDCKKCICTVQTSESPSGRHAGEGKIDQLLSEREMRWLELSEMN